MERVKHYILYIIIGGGAYWVTDIAIHWTLFETKIGFILMTVFVPCVVSIAYFLLRESIVHKNYPFGLPLLMLLGIWLFGPVAIAISVQPYGGTFLSSGNLLNFISLWSYFPMSTFIMSTYSGSLGGLLITSLILIIFAVVGGLRYFTPKLIKRATQ